jgi:hypothetical protein
MLQLVSITDCIMGDANAPLLECQRLAANVVAVTAPFFAAAVPTAADGAAADEIDDKPPPPQNEADQRQANINSMARASMIVKALEGVGYVLSTDGHTRVAQHANQGNTSPDVAIINVYSAWAPLNLPGSGDALCECRVTRGVVDSDHLQLEATLTHESVLTDQRQLVPAYLLMYAAIPPVHYERWTPELRQHYRTVLGSLISKKSVDYDVANNMSMSRHFARMIDAIGRALKFSQTPRGIFHDSTPFIADNAHPPLPLVGSTAAPQQQHAAAAAAAAPQPVAAAAAPAAE